MQNFMPQSLGLHGLWPFPSVLRITYQRLSRLLVRNGYRLLERLGQDEIWLRRRGLEPGCGLLGHGAWSTNRLVVQQMAMGVADVQLLESVMEQWSTGDLSEWLECPVGIVSVGLALSLLQDQQRGGLILAEALRRNMVFRWDRLASAMLEVHVFEHARWQAEAEREGRSQGLGLGKAWHLLSFEEVLESQWPLFRLLSMASKSVASVAQVMEHFDADGVMIHEPVTMPRIHCRLRVEPTVALEQPLPWDKPARGIPTDRLLLNADTCGLLGTFASIIHHMRRHLRREKELNTERTFHHLKNCTAACSQQSLNQEACHQKSVTDCVALGDDNKAIPLRCLSLRTSSGGLRLRRIRLLGRLSGWLDTAERLFRSYVEKYGLFLALWSLGRPELAGDEHIFDVLQSIQDMLQCPSSDCCRLAIRGSTEPALDTMPTAARGNAPAEGIEWAARG